LKFHSIDHEDGLIPEPYDAAEFRAFIVQEIEEIARWKPMLKETGFAAQ
jgi:hypothetical protein